jgi:hypothetical protein
MFLQNIGNCLLDCMAYHKVAIFIGTAMRISDLSVGGVGSCNAYLFQVTTFVG